MLRAAGGVAVRNVTEITKKVYSSGRMTEQMCKPVFFPIPRAGGSLDCDRHRAVSIMSHINTNYIESDTKTFTRKKKIKPEVQEGQCGFLKGRGTSSGIFMVRVLAERITEKLRDLFVCFFDYEETFNDVRLVNLMEVRTSTGVSGKEYRVTKCLYWAQKTCVRVDGEDSERQEIRGVRQGCVLPPDLFSLYGETTVRNIEEEHEGIRGGGRNINHQRHAADTVLTAHSRQQLESLFNKVKEE